jgi:hypothetical protein
LDRNDIPDQGKNAGLRYIAKLLLNSFWGKFGEKLTQSQTTFYGIDQADQFLRMLGDRRKKIKNFKIASNDVLLTEWEHVDSYLPENYNTNIFVACLTTCLARLELYKALEIVGENALYADTDSVIYVKNKNGPEIPLGDMLGQFTDELEGQQIEEFVSGGCKQYAYRLTDGREECKVRGFSLNFANSKVINFESVKKMVFGQMQCARTFNPSKITRHKASSTVYNKPQIKSYSVVNDKRVINMDTKTTLPFGY